MSDRIFLDAVRVRCKIGITAKERMEPQDVLIDVSLFVGLSRAGASDKLEETVNYRTAIDDISRFASSREFVLLEGLAEGLATLAIETYGVERIRVRVRKAKYSLEPSIGIEIERERKDLK
ncbi:MAG: dihydroneopterin aldolase [Thaumarchaeota archaeon]|nr:dihydroneopterin aldolase [Nitrososphaerota archaeon]